MKTAICSSCQKPKAHLNCGLCQAQLCKSCAQFLDDDTFSFLQPLPEKLSHPTYCAPCYNETIAGALDDYQQVMKRAEDVIVFFKNQGKETRLIKRAEKTLRVTECSDREETLLRLAFLAAQNNFNGLIDVDIVGAKIFDHAYQTTNYNGSGMPAHLDPNKYAPE